MLLVPLHPALAGTGPKPNENAALLYWQAVATLPPLSQEEQKQLREHGLTMPLDAHVRELLKRSAYALRMLHRGVARPYCEWGMGWEEGIEQLAPYLDGVRVLSTLCCLRARLRFQEGHHAEAIDDIVAALILGRHASQDGIFISILVNYANEERMAETLAPALPRLGREQLKDLQQRLENLPAGGSPAEALRKGEVEAVVGWVVRRIQTAHDKERALDFLNGLTGSPDTARSMLQECGGTADGVIKFAEAMRPSYARLAEQWDRPLDQFARVWEQEQKKQANNPVFRLLFPGVEKVRLAQARATLRRALLRAAVAVQRAGPDALRNYPDPVAGGPFQYTAFPGGFELRSNWKLDPQLASKWKQTGASGKPLVFTVGRRAK
jgi:hypothetical protein